ncbi:MAG: hypothetical protein R2811_06880 [Flavobacteriales bacterium]
MGNKLSPPNPIDYFGGSAFHQQSCPGVGVDAGTGVVTRGDAGIIDGDWHHCVLVFDPVQGSTISTVVMFIDGIEQPSIACTALDPNAAVNSTTTLPLIFGKTTSDIRYLHGI